MGQQQLLLLVLGAIIVGLAIVVGINLFGQGAVKANEDAVRQDVLSMMARVEEWYRKPTMLGGGGKTFAGLTLFPQLGYKYSSAVGTANPEVATAVYTNDNGTYTLGASSSAPTIEGVLSENSNIKVKYQISVNSTTKQTEIEEIAPST